jgi:large subunit ribosomal protein L21
MAYAIIKEGGRQFKVSEGETIYIDSRAVKPGNEIKLEGVLLYCNGDDVRIGRPVVKNVSVVGQVEEFAKAEKVIAYKFRKRESFEKTKGHRQGYSVVKIKQITAG